MDESEVRRIAEGRVWMGSMPKERKLVDEFGGLEQAIAHAKELADSEEDLKIEEFPKIENPYDFLGDLMKSLDPCLRTPLSRNRWKRPICVTN